MRKAAHSLPYVMQLLTSLSRNLNVTVIGVVRQRTKHFFGQTTYPEADFQANFKVRLTSAKSLM